MTVRASTRRPAAAPRRRKSGQPPAWAGLVALGALSLAQRQTLSAWLEEEKIAPREASLRLLSETGVKVSADTISHWAEAQRLSAQIRASSQLAADLQTDLQNLPVTLHENQISLASQATFEVEVARSGDLKNHIALRRLRQMDRSQALAERTLKLRRAQQRDQAAHRKQQLQLAREKFEYDAAAAALEHAKALKDIASNRALPREDKLQAIRDRLFGSPPPPPQLTD